MNKPEIKTIQFYDWGASWKYLKAKYNFVDDCVIEADGETSDIWCYIVDTQEIYNGKIFTFSNWELMHNNGEFAYCIPDWFKPILKAIIDEFGEIDEKCLTPNTKNVNFRSTW